MKVTYRILGNRLRLSVECPGGQIAIIQQDDDKEGWYYGPAWYPTRNEAAQAALNAVLDPTGWAWCPNCQNLVEAEGTYDHEFGGHDRCPLCGEHTEEITP